MYVGLPGVATPPTTLCNIADPNSPSADGADGVKASNTKKSFAQFLCFLAEDLRVLSGYVVSTIEGTNYVSMQLTPES